MWRFFLIAMVAIIAFLVIKKQKREPARKSGDQLLDKDDIADLFGNDLLEGFTLKKHEKVY
jgi:hypothetical protein